MSRLEVMELIDELTTAINCAQSHTSMCNRAVDAMEHAIRFIEAQECETPNCLHRCCACGHSECGHANENVQPNCSECECSGFVLAEEGARRPPLEEDQDLESRGGNQAMGSVSSPPQEPTGVLRTTAPENWLVQHLTRQSEFSQRTFGPGVRTAGVVDHIRKELREIEAKPHDLSEWIDVVILGFDGAWRAGYSPSEIVAALVAKQAKNEARQWPDWRTAAPDKAIEHVRIAGEASTPAPEQP